jgi:uncharacterized protein YciI
MFIIKLDYKVEFSEVEKYLQAHREFLDYYYKIGLLLISGPLKPRTGGVILALTQDREYLEAIFKQDPYYLAEIAEYNFIEFVPVMYRDEIKALINAAEGNLC